MSEMGPYPALTRDWHDGDTGHFDLDLGFDVIEAAYDLDGKPRLSARVYGINAPELATAEGKLSLAYVEKICPPGMRVTILSHGWDKYGGRFDATITLPTAVVSADGVYTGTDLAQLMLHSNTGVVVLR